MQVTARAVGGVGRVGSTAAPPKCRPTARPWLSQARIHPIGQAHLVSLGRAPGLALRASTQEEAPSAPSLVGEDAAAFDVQQQSVKSWTLFFVLLTTVLGALYAASVVACVVARDQYQWHVDCVCDNL